VTSVAHTRGESRAARPGSRARTVAIPVIFAVPLGAPGYGTYGIWANGHQGNAAGNPAKWLPKRQLRTLTDRTLVGTYASPAITMAGDDVRVRTPTFSAFAVVTGAAVPGEGLSYRPDYITSTRTVHIWGVKGYIACRRRTLTR
jgi:hypothetical protein